jgi:hypothetical protein
LFTPSASKKPPDSNKREQNSRWHLYNRLTQ